MATRLTTQSADAIRWITNVLVSLGRQQTLPLLSVITASLISRVSSTLAFLLPLKVILLAASPGIPKYFEGFISPESRDAWILALAAGTVFSYVLSVAMDSFANRVSETASANIIAVANPITLPKQQHEQGRRFYSRFCQLTAATLFSVAGIGMGLLVNPPPFLVLLAFALTIFLLSSMALASSIALLEKLRTFLAHSTQDYIRIMSSVAFLVAFFVILVPFVTGDDANVLLALIAIILLRQLLAALTLAINETINLNTNREPVNALVFPGSHLPRNQQNRHPEFSQLFQKEERERILRRAFLAEGKPQKHTLDTQWLDSGVRTLRLFRIDLYNMDAPLARYQLQVLPPKGPVTFEQEQFLFRHTANSDLPALPILFRYEYAGFHCQVRDLGGAVPAQAQDWQALYPELLATLWCHAPDSQLIAAYTASFPLLSERLNEYMLAPLRAAADTECRKHAFDQLLNQLPAIRALLNELPVYISNRALNWRNLAKNESNQPVLMSWADWELNIVGAQLPPHAKEEQLNAMLEPLNGLRQNLPPLETTHIMIVRHLSDMERRINAAHYSEALEKASQALGAFNSL